MLLVPQACRDVMSTLLTMTSHKEISRATNLDKLIHTIPSARTARLLSVSHLQAGSRESSASSGIAVDHSDAPRKRTYTEPSSIYRQPFKPLWKLRGPHWLGHLNPSSKLIDHRLDASFSVEPRIRLHTVPSVTKRKRDQVELRLISHVETDGEQELDRKQGPFHRTAQPEPQVRTSSSFDNLASSSGLFLPARRPDASPTATCLPATPTVVPEDASGHASAARPLIVLPTLCPEPGMDPNAPLPHVKVTPPSTNP